MGLILKKTELLILKSTGGLSQPEWSPCTYLGEAVAKLALVTDDGRGDEDAVLGWVLAAVAPAVEVPRPLEVVAPVDSAVQLQKRLTYKRTKNRIAKI